VTFGQIAANQVRRRIEIGRDKHVQDRTSVRFEQRRDRMTGCWIELFLETESGSADIDRYAIETTRLG